MMRTHKWKRMKTSIGNVWECCVCRTWTRKNPRAKDRPGQCCGKEIK